MILIVNVGALKRGDPVAVAITREGTMVVIKIVPTDIAAEVINPPIILMKNIKIDLGLGSVQQAGKEVMAAADKTIEVQEATDQEVEAIHLKEVLAEEAEATLEANIIIIEEPEEEVEETRIEDVDPHSQINQILVDLFFHSSNSKIIRMSHLIQVRLTNITKNTKMIISRNKLKYSLMITSQIVGS